jgi:hypothetical protein
MTRAATEYSCPCRTDATLVTEQSENEKAEMADEERDPDGLTDEELEDDDDTFLDEPAVGPHGEPGIPQIEPLPGRIELPPVPGTAKREAARLAKRGRSTGD